MSSHGHQTRCVVEIWRLGNVYPVAVFLKPSSQLVRSQELCQTEQAPERGDTARRSLAFGCWGTSFRGPDAKIDSQVFIRKFFFSCCVFFSPLTCVSFRAPYFRLQMRFMARPPLSSPSSIVRHRYCRQGGNGWRQAQTLVHVGGEQVQRHVMLDDAPSALLDRMYTANSQSGWSDSTAANMWCNQSPGSDN